MQHIKNIRIFLLLFSIGFILWMGGSLIRSVIAFSVFEPSATQTLVRQVSNDILMQSVYLFSATSSYTTLAYLLSLLCAVIITLRLRNIFKENGWLMMSAILYFSTMPINLILLYFDIRLSIEVFWNWRWEFYHPEILKYFLNRITNPLWNSLSGISFLANLTIVYLVIFQPLKK